jgi:hypothetical protein
MTTQTNLDLTDKQPTALMRLEAVVNGLMNPNDPPLYKHAIRRVLIEIEQLKPSELADLKQSFCDGYVQTESAETWSKKWGVNETVVSGISDTGGIDKYFDDLEKWESRFYCNECGCDDIKDFAYDRTVANGEVWHCKHCKTEAILGNKPNEDNY